MRTKLLSLLAVLVLWALPCWADWGQAESPDFPLDTTIPEPAALLSLLALGTVFKVLGCRCKVPE